MAEDSPADASSVRVPHPEHAGSCDVSESSSELGPGGLDNEGEEGASSDALGQTEAAAQEGGSGERSVGSRVFASRLACPHPATRGRRDTAGIDSGFSLFR